jgi:hypothetical protein
MRARAQQHPHPHTLTHLGAAEFAAVLAVEEGEAQDPAQRQRRVARVQLHDEGVGVLTRPQPRRGARCICDERVTIARKSHDDRLRRWMVAATGVPHVSAKIAHDQAV